MTVVGCDRANRGTRARYLLPCEPLEHLPSIGTTRLVSPRRWRRLVRDTLARVTPSITSLQAAADADIRILPYQLEPALAVVNGLAARVLIADDVGLGKTIQAGLIVTETLARRSDAHVLVISPAGLREQWRSELTDRFRLAPVMLDSAALQRSPLDGRNPWAVYPLVLTSTDYIKRPEVMRALEPLVWDVLVVDEAHGTGGQTDRHAAATLLAQRARTVVMLTATPHSGDEAAFGRLTTTGDLEPGFPLLVFRRTRAAVSEATDRRTRWLAVRPARAELQMHRALMAYVQRVWHRPAAPAAKLAMIVLTRRACSSASSLARSVGRRLALLSEGVGEGRQIALPLSLYASADAEPDVQIGAPGLEDGRDEREALEEILTLARLASASEGKIRVLGRLLRRSRETAIVFTEYRDTLATLDRELGDFGTCQLHGGLTAAERANVLRQFTTGARRVLLATDAASEGLNLHQGCRLVVHLEVPWTPTRIEQRVGRVDRIGQSRTVHQVHLVGRGTVEESRVSDLVRRKLRAVVALNDLSAVTTDEQQTAAYVMGDDPLPSRRPTAGLPGGLITADLRSLAMTEAARLLAARRLAPPGASDVLVENRPFAVHRRRHPTSSPLWAVWLEYTDAEGELVWGTLVGVIGSCARAAPQTTADVRALIDESWPRVRGFVADERSHRDDALTWIRTSAARALRREKAIARGIERRHGRMASPLLQGSLFDRRADRDALAQRELVALALARCRTRIAALERLEQTIVTTRPAFASIP